MLPDNPRFIPELLVLLREENFCLNEIRRLNEELAELQSENRRKEKERLTEKLAELQAENHCLTEIEGREEELAALELETRCLDELDDAVWETMEEYCTFEDRDEIGNALTEEEIRSVRCAEDVFAAGMEYVQRSKATLVYFSGDEVTAICGEVRRAVQRPEAARVGDWLAVLQPILGAAEYYCTCPLLYFDETCLILADRSEDRTTERLLRYADKVATHLQACSDD